MAFPTTPILDDFNRSDVGPPPSSNWSQGWSNLFGQFKVVSNQCVVDSLIYNYASNYWNVETFGPDCEAYLTIIAVPPAGYAARIFIRVTDIAGTTPDGYMLKYLDGVIQIQRVDDGVSTVLGADYSQVLSNGDKFGIRAAGDTFTCFIDTGGGWTELFSRTDTTYRNAGYINLLASHADLILDDFGGGNYYPDPSDAIVDTVNPTVVLGSLSIGPDSVSAIADTVNPTTVLGSLTIAPDSKTAIVDTVNPSVVLGSISLTPNSVGGIASTVNPTVVLGSISLVPTIIHAICRAVDPSVVVGTLTITPDPCSAIASTVNPSVNVTLIVSPSSIYAIVDTVNPSIILGSVTISAIVSTIAKTISPKTWISGFTSSTCLMFTYDSTDVEFSIKEIRSVIIEHIQKEDQFWDQANKFHQYLVGKGYRKVTINFRQDDSDTFGKIETLWNQVDTYKQPEKMTLYYRYKIDSSSILVQMNRGDFEKKYYKHSRSARDITTQFIETES